MVRWTLAAIIIVVIGVAVYGSRNSAQLVDTAVARRGSISQYIEERARTQLPRTYRITMPFTGRILTIDLREGYRVA